MELLFIYLFIFRKIVTSRGPPDKSLMTFIQIFLFLPMNANNRFSNYQFLSFCNSFPQVSQLKDKYYFNEWSQDNLILTHKELKLNPCLTPYTKLTQICS